MDASFVFHRDLNPSLETLCDLLGLLEHTRTPLDLLEQFRGTLDTTINAPHIPWVDSESSWDSMTPSEALRRPSKPPLKTTGMSLKLSEVV